MRISIICLLIVTVHFLFGSDQYQQVRERRGPRGRAESRFNPVQFRAYPAARSDSSYRVYFITDVMYDYLQFTLEDDNYRADFQISVDVISKNSTAVYSQIWETGFLLQEFDLTNRRDLFHLSVDSLDIPPGRYKIEVNYRDLQASRRQEFALDFFLPDVKSFYASPPLFCDRSLSGQEYPAAFPARPLAFREHLFFNRPLSLFLETFAAKAVPVKVKVTIQKEKSAAPLFQSDTLLSAGALNQTALLNLPSLHWDEGKYELHLLYHAGTDSSKQNLPFYLRWYDKPRSLRNPESALQPLQLITSPEEFEHLTSGNDAEKKKKFREFWKEKDPTPGTAYNEVEAEFYTRVDSANIRWGRKRQSGWRTDPGSIYVQYGTPDEVEDYSLNPQQPFLRWTYNLPDKKLIFTFRAVDGRKRYKLVESKEEQK